jgi:C-terminal processing protease CtpA/Prc
MMHKRVGFIALTAAMAWTPLARAQAPQPNPSAEQAAQGYIGLVLAKTAPDAPLVIQKVFERGPAQAAGLLADDQILAIDGIEVDTLTLEDAVSRLRGPVGTWVTLAILSGEDRFDCEIQRATFAGMPAS